MIDLSYRASLATRITKVFPEYWVGEKAEKLSAMLDQISEADANYLYALLMKKKQDEIKSYIESHT